MLRERRGVSANAREIPDQKAVALRGNANGQTGARVTHDTCALAGVSVAS